MISKSGTTALLLGPLAFCLLYIPIISALVTNEIFRFIIAQILYIKFKNKVALVPDGADGFWGYKKEGSSRNVIVFVTTKAGTLKRDKIAKFYKDKIQSFIDQDGNRPYEKFEKILTSFLGYFCWKNNDDFDIQKHIRVLSDKEVFSKEQVQNLNAKLVKDDMEEGKPQWELVIFPRYDDGTGEEKSILLARFLHAYMDGLSFIMLFKQYLSADFQYTIDPMNFQIPPWKKLLFYISTLIYGPFMVIMMGYEKIFLKPWIRLNPKNQDIPREKYYTWSRLVKNESVAAIRTSAGKATVTNVISTALASSIARNLPRDRVLPELIINEILAYLPYPNSNPQNRYAYYSYSVPIPTLAVGGREDEDFKEKVRQCRNASLKGLLGPETLTTFYTFKILGRFPSLCFPYFLYGSYGSVLLSNVPFSKTRCTFGDGNEILDVGACTPQPNDLGFSITSISYDDGIKVCGCADSTWMTKEELSKIINGIPTEIERMAKQCSLSLLNVQPVVNQPPEGYQQHAVHEEHNIAREDLQDVQNNNLRCR